MPPVKPPGRTNWNPPCIVENYILSHTAKYWGFYGTHFHGGVKCYVVGAVNTEDGQTVTRHYNERESVNETLAKHKALEYWEEVRATLSRAPTEDERSQDQALLEIWNESANRAALRTADGRKNPWIN